MYQALLDLQGSVLHTLRLKHDRLDHALVDAFDDIEIIDEQIEHARQRDNQLFRRLNRVQNLYYPRLNDLQKELGLAHVSLMCEVDSKTETDMENFDESFRDHLHDHMDRFAFEFETACDQYRSGIEKITPR
tara:strand:- start:5 stop:400 length:396 start_codon:yes stop_codon:yes gene_type:complete